MKKAICLVLCALCFTACGNSETDNSSKSADKSTTTTAAKTAITDTTTETTTTTTKTTTNTTTVTTTKTTTTTKPKKTEFAIGETWTVSGQWKLTITGVQETEYRNPFSDNNPAAVYIVSCEYENIGYVDSNGIMSGLFFNLDENIIDNKGYMGYNYPGEITDYPKETPVGAKCKGQYCIGVDNAGDFKLNVEQYDGKNKKQTATFGISTNGISKITTTVITEPEIIIETDPAPTTTTSMATTTTTQTTTTTMMTTLPPETTIQPEPEPEPTVTTIIVSR